MPPSCRSRHSSNGEELPPLDPSWIRQHGCKDVASALEAMQNAIRSGRMQEARSVGQSTTVPLSLTTADLVLQSKIAEGSESVVFAGKCKGLDVAGKKFKIGSSQDLVRFRKELLLLASFNHPNIVPLLGAKALPPDYTLVLPLHTDNLHQKLHQQGWRPTWTEVVRVGLELTSALCHIHEKDVVHRDIKPGNLLMTSCGSIQVADFGTAEPQDRLLAAVQDTSGKYKLGHKPSGGFHKRLMAGTLEYMAPEVLLKEPQTLAADVYAAAVTLNELATGIFPYSDCNKDNPDCHTVLEMGYNRQELASAVVGQGLRPLLPKLCPPGWHELMEACWQLNPSERPSALTFLAGLKQLEAAIATWQPHHSLALKYAGIPHSISMNSISSWTLATGVDPLLSHNDKSAEFLSHNDKSAEVDMSDKFSDVLSQAKYMDVEYSKENMTVAGGSSYRDEDDTSSTEESSMPDFDILSHSTSEKELVVDIIPLTSGASNLPPQLFQQQLAQLAKLAGPGSSSTVSNADVMMQSMMSDTSLMAVESVHASLPLSAGAIQLLQQQQEQLQPPHHEEKQQQQIYNGRVSAGVFDTFGAREKMEDRSLVAPNFGGLDNVHLFGVFDGHRGRAAAEFVADHLPAVLTHTLNIQASYAPSSASHVSFSSTASSSALSSSVPSSCLSGNQQTSCSDDSDEQLDLSARMDRSACHQPECLPASASSCMQDDKMVYGAEGMVSSALVQAFLGLDQKFAVQQERKWRARVAQMGLFAAGRRPFPGCTALTAFIVGNKLYTANAGDCRAVLCRGGKPLQLNREHNADCAIERSRVQSAGGAVVLARDGWRLGMSQIQVTRSIGDFDEKQCGMSAKPEVSVVELSEDDEFFIIGSDGLWENIGNEEAVGMVRDTVKDPVMCGKRLATEAMVRGSKDNITALVVFLRPVSTVERVFAHGVATHGFTATEYSSR